MVSRSAVSASLLLLAVCAAAFCQTAQPAPTGPRVFHDPSLGVTYFYPQRFTPVEFLPAKAEPKQNCPHATLSAKSVTPVGASAFVFSSISADCPAMLKAAASNLDGFTRQQALLQLKQYGNPVVFHDPSHYTIDGHPAAITIASVKLPAPVDVNNIAPPKIMYAAKACVLGEVPDKHGKMSLAEQTRHIICFDFTTQHQDLLPLVLAFTVQFDGQSPESMVPGGILH
jgi:hypothetical protein